MSQLSELFTKLGDNLLGYLNALVAFLPNLAGAVLVVFAAWLIGRLLRALTAKILGEFNRIFERLFVRGVLTHFRLSDFAIRALANVIFVLVLLFGLDAAVRVLQLNVAIRWLDKAILYVPTILAALVILIVGVLASRAVRDITSSALSASGAVHSAQIGRLAQIAALTVAIVVGLDQIEIDVDLPISLIIVIAASGLGGLALAFGLGARDYTANMIAAQQIARQFQSGDAVEIDDTAGTVAEITSTSVVIGTKSGRAIIPARLFLDRVVHVKEPAEKQDEA